MAQDKKTILLYTNLIDTIRHMDNETAGQFFKHYLEYVNDLNPTSDNPIVNIAFEPVKQRLKADLKKWEEKRARNIINGKLGGRPKTITKPTKKVIKKTVTPKATSLPMPTLEEFTSHAIDRKSNVDKEDVRLKYLAWKDNNWCINRNGKQEPIKNWKSTLTNTVKYLKESHKLPSEPIQESIEDRIKRLNNEAKSQG